MEYDNLRLYDPTVPSNPIFDKGRFRRDNGEKKIFSIPQIPISSKSIKAYDVWICSLNTSSMYLAWKSKAQFSFFNLWVDNRYFNPKNLSPPISIIKA